MVDRHMRVGRPIRTVVWASIVLVVGVVIAYLLLIRAQGQTPPDAVTVPFVATYLTLMAVLLWLSLLDRPLLASVRPALRAAASAGLLLLGIFAAASIGLPIFAAGILAAIAAFRTLFGPHRRNAILSEIAAALIAVIVLVGGFEVTQRLIFCPPTGTSTGSGSGFVTGGYHYECVDGTLTMHSGDCNGFSQGGVDPNGNVTATGGC
jgi:small-conductance mechanosensitive channel